MNSELAKLDSALISLGFVHKQYNIMSKNRTGNPLVTDSRCEAYDYDEITKSIYQVNPHSVDAILLKDDMFFIEFKRVVNRTNPLEQKNIKQDLQLKLSESLILFYKYFVKKYRINLKKFKKIAIIVVDSVQSPISATSGVLARLSGGGVWLSSSNLIYHIAPTKNGEHLFFDDLLMWNDLNFSIQISQL